jgi:hypothetical protein
MGLRVQWEKSDSKQAKEDIVDWKVISAGEKSGRQRVLRFKEAGEGLAQVKSV